MTDYTEIDLDDLRKWGFDPSKWARAFCEKNPDVNVDEDLMLMWFDYIIMHTLFMKSIEDKRGTIGDSQDDEIDVYH